MASTDLPDGWCMLDPIKFGIVCPGMKTDGQLETKGIPADIVTAYLGRHGIVPSRTTDHMVLFLFSDGCHEGQVGHAAQHAARFQGRLRPQRAARRGLAAVVAAAPQRYAGKGLKDLGDEMWAHLRKSKQGHWQAQAYATLPTPQMTPRRAFQRLMAGDAEKVPLDEMADRVVAVGVIPYPPGIPIVMPGESIGPPTGRGSPTCARCRSTVTCSPDSPRKSRAPKSTTASYHVYCVKEASARQRGARSIECT